MLLDIHATVRYHIALTRSGGLADHADASYHLAYYLRYQGVGAPIALDWGFDAPIRYLSEGTVTPLEIFGYGSPQQPDSSFESRLQPFMQDSTNRYLLHAPTFTVFQGRREVFFAVAAERHLETVLEASFGQRDGTPLYELWQVRDIGPAN
ncbi:MAG: hypothetical protein R2932_08945 [Caldilineaceae bacterium]